MARKAAPPSEIAKAAPKSRVRKPKADPEPEPRLSISDVRIGKKSYALVHDQTCAICNHPARVKIEEQILFKTKYVAIARMFSEQDYTRADGEIEKWPKITGEQISAHFNANHCPVDAKTMEDLSEQARQEQGVDYEQLGDRFIDGLVFARFLIGRVEERVIRGEIEPTVKDGLTAARLDTAVKLASLAAEANSDAANDESWYYEQAFKVFFDEAEQIMKPQDWVKFMDVLREHPVLRNLIEQRQRALNGESGEVA